MQSSCFDLYCTLFIVSLSNSCKLYPSSLSSTESNILKPARFKKQASRSILFNSEKDKFSRPLNENNIVFLFAGISRLPNSHHGFCDASPSAAAGRNEANKADAFSDFSDEINSSGYSSCNRL